MLKLNCRSFGKISRGRISLEAQTVQQVSLYHNVFPRKSCPDFIIQCQTLIYTFYIALHVCVCASHSDSLLLHVFSICISNITYVVHSNWHMVLPYTYSTAL